MTRIVKKRWMSKIEKIRVLKALIHLKSIGEGEY